MCFSSDNSIEDITAKMRNMNVVRSCGNTLRKAFWKVDFKLADKFCEGHDLKESQGRTKLPDELLIFSASLFGLNRSHFLKNEVIDSMTDDVTHVGVNGNGDVSTDDSTQDILWAILNQHKQLNCLLQTVYC